MTHTAAAPPAHPTAAAALALHQAGCSVIPTRTDGTKAPVGYWDKYKKTRADADTVRAWFADGHPGVGVATGAVSGALEMLEFEGRAVAEGVLAAFTELAGAAGLGELLGRVMAGYAERTPSGGIHLLYRVDGAAVPGNTKLAQRHAREDELTDHERQVLEQHPGKRFHRVLVETRGEGGYVVLAPSGGPVHETGAAWELLAGGPDTIPTITAEERDALVDAARTLDQIPAPDTPARRPAAPHVPDTKGGVSPGDDYETHTDWADILGPHGWTLVTTRGTTLYWRRPGKRLGISATTGNSDDRDRLYVFTTSTEFDAEIPYTKFGAYALLEHGGNHTTAARELHRAGYGRPAPEPARPHNDADELAALIAPPPGPGGDGAPPPPSAALTVDEPKTYSLTDDGNALRLVDAHRAVIRYCPERASWLSWDGHRWRWDRAGRLQEYARAIARDLPQADTDQRRHRKTSLSARALSATLQVARTDPRIVAHIDHLDAQPYELNTPAGTVNLRTGELLAPDPARLHARSTTVAPDFDRVPERWMRFLADTFAGDPALTLYVQRLLGVTLAGTVLEQLLPFCFGDGANGKTTLLGVIQRLLGIGEDGYALSVASDLLIASNHQGHPTELAQLSGARLVVTSELEDGQRFAEARVKMLTGRDPISARFMHGNFFTFRPTHTMWLLANHQPSVRAGGPALWRRLKLLPFLHVVPPEQRDPHLEDRLVDDEGPAILAWAIRGAADYFSHGIAEPESVRAATAEYQNDQDSIKRFIEEMCEIGSPALQHMAVRTTELRSAYESWCQSEGEKAVSAKSFTQALQRRYNVVGERSRTARYYRGIRLRDPGDGSDDAQADLSHADPDEGHGWGYR